MANQDRLKSITNQDRLKSIEMYIEDALDTIPNPPPGRGLAIVRTALENVLALSQFYRNQSNNTTD
jgi:hypothetical protein